MILLLSVVCIGMQKCEFKGQIWSEYGLKAFTDEGEKSSNVWLQFGLPAGGNYKIRFISKDDDNDVAVRVFSLVSVPTDKRAAFADLVNKLNCEFRFVKFVCDDDGDVNVEYDFLETSDPAQCAYEITVRFSQIIDEAYPRMMKLMFA